MIIGLAISAAFADGECTGTNCRLQGCKTKDERNDKKRARARSNTR